MRRRFASAPRKLLAAVPGLEFVELKESEICCGSAGIYNVVHNDLAEKILQSKMRRIDETKADLILTANPGCLLQLRAGVSRAGGDRRVLHVVELLDEAYQGFAAECKSIATSQGRMTIMATKTQVNMANSARIPRMLPASITCRITRPRTRVSNGRMLIRSSIGAAPAR